MSGRSGIAAGASYFAIVFAAGFVMGVFRTLAVTPRIGALGAVALELPLMLAASWIVCGWIVRRFSITTFGERLITSGLALILLAGAEFGFAALLGRSPSLFWRGLGTPDGLLGLAGQVCFAAMPLVRRA